MNNITLIGMPGAGKSTIGVVLAKVLGYDFIDSDLLIQKEEGKLLWQIMRDCGNEGFNAIEERVNSEIQTDRSVIATGGSVVYGPRAMAHLRSISTVVYLKVSCDTLTERLGDLNKRGVVLDPDETLLDLYNRRVPLYEKYAHITVDVGNCNVHQAVAAITALLPESAL
jgi:shikimate kinase